MNNYEHTLIAKIDLTNDAFSKLIEKYSNIITENDGKIVNLEKWGVMNFASKIKQYKKGNYLHVKFEGSGKTIDKLEKTEKIDSSVLRFLTVTVLFLALISIPDSKCLLLLTKVPFLNVPTLSLPFV